MAIAITPQVSFTRDQALFEIRKCILDPVYFVDTYCQLRSEVEGAWVRFRLWPFQRDLVDTLHTGENVVALKARQLGMTWLCLLGRVLHKLLFEPIATALLFSRRDAEATDLLARVKQAFRRLPDWMRGIAGGEVVSNDHVWQLGNGSIARAFPTTAGDSYTASIAFCDEFDLVENQGDLITAVKPTIDAGGQMILVSRADKDRPGSTFKNIYLEAKKGLRRWRAVFLPWWVRPDRSPQWYQEKVQESMATDGTLDQVYEQYPSSDVEALAQKSGNKRLPAPWLVQVYQERTPLKMRKAPAVPGLLIYTPPSEGLKYVGGVDPAEGNPTSDESCATFVEMLTGKQMAVIAGKFQPEEMAGFVKQVADWYHKAKILPERNNHGHAFIQAYGGDLLAGTDGKTGWLTTRSSKTLCYDNAATHLQQQDCGIADLETFTQLGSIEGANLSAPEGWHDDRAIAWVLAQQARSQKGKSRRLRTW